MTETSVTSTGDGTTRLPVLVDETERSSLARLLDYVARFDSLGFGDDARRLASLLDDPARTGQHVDYTYSLLGPWGSHGADDEAHAVTQVRAARAEHWAEGWGRDERYHQIRAARRPHVTFDDGAQYTGAEEEIEVPDAPLTSGEQIENARRVAAAETERDALYAHLRERTQQNSADR